KLKERPRPRALRPAAARVAEAQAQVKDAQTQLSLWESVVDPRAVAKDEINKKRYALDAATARLDQARSQLDLLKAGSWKVDIAVAEAQVASARAQVQSAQTEVERLTVRSPVDGQVLQVNIRAGEYAPAGPSATPLMLVGDTR